VAAVVVYGVVEPGTRLPRTAGIDGVRPRLVEARTVAALVGDLERDELLARRRDLTAHMDVLTAATERTTVLPMQFGVVMAGDDEVREDFLEPLEERLRDLLDRFENLVEMRLSARYDEQELLAEIVATDGRVQRLRGAAGRELALGELVADAYQRLCARDARPLLEAIGTLVEDEVSGDGREWNLLTASFLVRRSNRAAFERHVERWAETNAGRATCELAGPMPPYSFVDLELAPPEAAWA
jgi:gas vesicle protein GvpL/GvpF